MKKIGKIFWLLIYVAVMAFAIYKYLFFGFALVGLTLPPIIDKWLLKKSN